LQKSDNFHSFYKSTAKRPIPVELEARRQKVDGKKVKREKTEGVVNACTPTELAAEIQKAVGAALIHLTPSTSTAVRIGYAGWTAQEIADNANTVAQVLVDKYVPQGWKNLKSVHIKGSDTAALPVWLTDQLWLEEKDIVANDSEEAKALSAAEKPNIGKKRKSLDSAPEETAPATKKSKKAKVEVKDVADDTKLDKEISERKAKLKKQKAAAKKAVEV
jgi:ribosome biogenesis protein UTP30